MKKRYAFLPVIALLLSPSLFRSSFTSLYDNLVSYHPIGGPVLTVALDIAWLWVVLFGIMLLTWLARKIRTRINLPVTTATELDGGSAKLSI
ncbi:hypothetical protein [Spirosoma sp.]|uniref:hypothetical protein n=1 Tax=Spirosoma sp. TaxID=1899569 RepID=UPI003B3A8342